MIVEEKQEYVLNRAFEDASNKDIINEIQKMQAERLSQQDIKLITKIAEKARYTKIFLKKDIYEISNFNFLHPEHKKRVDKYGDIFLYTEDIDEYKFLYAVCAEGGEWETKIDVGRCETLADGHGNKYLHIVDLEEEYSELFDEDEYPCIIDLDKQGNEILYVSDGSYSKIYERNKKIGIRL